MKIADSRPFFASFFLFLFVFSMQSSQAQDIQWLTDVNKGVEKAGTEKKLVLLHFTASWSNPCKEIDNFVFTSRDVARAISTNVIPVRIDVDDQPELAAEYGVAKVPYDIMITPAKRVVYRRHSPKDSASYAQMIQRLERTIQSIANVGMATANHNLDVLKQLSDSSAKSVQQNPGFVPSHPEHQAPRPSEDSQELNRKSGRSQNAAADQNQSRSQFVANPMAAPSSPMANSSSPNSLGTTTNPLAAENKERELNPTPGPLKILNEKFFAADSNGVSAPKNEAQVAQSNGSTDSNGLVATRMQPNLQKAPETPGTGGLSQAAPMFKSDLESKGSFEKAAPIATVSPSSENLNTRAVFDRSAFSNPNPVAPANSTVQAGGASSSEPPTAVPPSFALKGKCPVALIQQGKWLSGDPKWGCVHRGQTYTFSNEESLKIFQSDPDAYSPLLSGYDPVVYAENGQLVYGKEEHGVFMGKSPNLRVVLFRDLASRKEFEGNPKKYIQSIRVAMENSGGSSSMVR